MAGKDAVIRNSKNLSVFNAISRAYNDFAKKKLAEYKFTPNEISTMIYLLENDDLDTAKGISSRFGVTQSLICRSVDSLTKRGFITSETDAADRRVNHLNLEIDDKHLLSILKNLNSEFMNYIFKGVSNEDIETFRKVLESIDETIH